MGGDIVTQSAIFNEIKSKFEELTENKISYDSDIAIRMNIVAGEIANIYEQIDFCKKQMFPQTATGEYLTHHAQIRDIKRLTANRANGSILFSRNSPATSDILIPMGTMCGTSLNGNSVVYVTTENSKIAKGETEISVKAEASEIGAIGNIKANSINVLISGVLGVDRINNPQDFIGGMDDESDESLRKRIVNSYLNISNGSNLKFYEDVAMTVKNVWSAKAVVNNVDTTKVDLYISDMFRQPTDELVTQVQTAIDKARELNVKVTVKKATVVPFDITLKIIVKDLNANSVILGDVKDFISNRVYNLKIGEDFNPYTIGTGISDVFDGFENMIFESPSTIKSVEKSQILKPNSVGVTIQRG